MKTYEEWRHSSTHLTSALDGNEWSASNPGCFNPPQGKSTQYPLDRGLGGPQSWSGCGDKETKLLLLPGIESQLSSLHLSHYPDGAIPTPSMSLKLAVKLWI
jgi:hypothetical protein